jgi:hypothetical protein
MNMFAVIFWTLIVISLTKAATISVGWIILFLFLAIIAS